MTKEEIKKKVKDLSIEELGIFSNQISAFANSVKAVGSELQREEEKNKRSQTPRLFDFNKRGVTLNLKLNEAITYIDVIHHELDERIQNKLGLKLDYEYVDGIMGELYELKMGS